MKAFEWISPTNINDAVKLLDNSENRGADMDEAPRPIAGGQDLLTTMKDYITRPTCARGGASMFSIFSTARQ